MLAIYSVEGMHVLLSNPVLEGVILKANQFRKKYSYFMTQAFKGNDFFRVSNGGSKKISNSLLCVVLRWPQQVSSPTNLGVNHDFYMNTGTPSSDKKD